MHSKSYLILTTIVSALGGLLFGYDTGVINGSQYYFSQYFDLDAVMKGWVVGSALLGCFVGAIIAGPISNFMGRKYSLILSSILFSLSAWGSGLPAFLPESVSLLVVFRLIGGLGIGLASMNAPTYIAEIAPAKIRGTLVSYYQLAIVIGFFVVFLATYFIGSTATEAENIQNGWRYMFWSELIPSLSFLILLFFVPKSPRWLALKGLKSQALEVLTKIHGKEVANIEIQEIEKSLQKEEGSKKVNIFAKGIFSIIVIGTVLSVLQQFTGINAVLYYGADIFEKALGFGKEDVLAQQILLAGVNLVFTFVAMATVDRFGRKPLIYIGSVGMIVGFLLLGVSLMTGNVGLVSLIGVLMFVAAFAMSMGPVVWVVLSEMFPNKIRSIGMSIAVAAQWAANYVVSQSFPIIAESEVNNNDFWSGSLPYFIFSVFILAIIFFTMKYIPETKGKSLEELEDMWEIPDELKKA
ncbi:MAG: sugar porter family MFS transporter [Salegentibacter sp.]|uniref:MFS transporter, SP family, xylose:H+ symportor n=1 Tax=Salegentibacter flavus TaxID=287099 RepID=A0A1I4XFU8_9FLAO|nr:MULTISPECIES: sugar porter family MFS transporter [Salegentibacter]MDR9455920.1 sugar porter family MFS transporter [Salegentibacter sp.]SFN24774.1 MFS transporter, SP family, xylose:H+ symportor [Salegentibacter flavus]